MSEPPNGSSPHGRESAQARPPPPGSLAYSSAWRKRSRRRRQRAQYMYLACTSPTPRSRTSSCGRACVVEGEGDHVAGARENGQVVLRCARFLRRRRARLLRGGQDARRPSRNRPRTRRLSTPSLWHSTLTDRQDVVGRRVLRASPRSVVCVWQCWGACRV